MLNDDQLTLLAESELADSLSVQQVNSIAEQGTAENLSDEQLLAFLQITNLLYRSGQPLITDQQYDHVYLEALRSRHPAHAYLNTVEPEPAFGAKTVELPKVMLSTEKAYSFEHIERWLQRIAKVAEESSIDYPSLLFRMTPKLDGYAAYDDGVNLYTRGDGRRGTDITRVFERGLIVADNGLRGQGAGEIVVNQDYFKENLAGHFDNARNFQGSIIKEKDLEEHALAAIQKHAAVFYPFAQLPAWQGNALELSADFDTIVADVLGKVPYDVDGVVLEVLDERIKLAMGATRHHHRWQIAFKHNAEKVAVNVISVIPQTSRSGRVNPVAELEPTRLSGAIISRATAHHYGMVREKGIGPGTVIELTRSGMVIPKIERVITPQVPQIPEHCPSCQSELTWDSDYLYCLNSAHCPAQIENSLEHFFRTLANVDGFGQKTIEKLHAAGIDSVYAIFTLTFEQLQTMGFGDKTAQNLLDQLQRSRTEAIEDWRFLGAFGIHRMGLGNCERLLQHHRLLDVFDLSIAEIVAIEGFAEKTAEAMLTSLSKIKQDFLQIHGLGFNLKQTPLLSEKSTSQSVIAGKTIVFTGTMQQGSREDMQKQAKLLGAKVGSAVTSKTDYLVTGEKVGAAKINAAREHQVTVLTEQEYLSLLNSLGIHLPFFYP